MAASERVISPEYYKIYPNGSPLNIDWKDILMHGGVGQASLVDGSIDAIKISIQRKSHLPEHLNLIPSIWTCVLSSDRIGSSFAWTILAEDCPADTKLANDDLISLTLPYAHAGIYRVALKVFSGRFVGPKTFYGDWFWLRSVDLDSYSVWNLQRGLSMPFTISTTGNFEDLINVHVQLLPLGSLDRGDFSVSGAPSLLLHHLSSNPLNVSISLRRLQERILSGLALPSSTYGLVAFRIDENGRGVILGQSRPIWITDGKVENANTHFGRRKGSIGRLNGSLPKGSADASNVVEFEPTSRGRPYLANDRVQLYSSAEVTVSSELQLFIHCVRRDVSFTRRLYTENNASLRTRHFFFDLSGDPIVWGLYNCSITSTNSGQFGSFQLTIASGYAVRQDQSVEVANLTDPLKLTVRFEGTGWIAIRFVLAVDSLRSSSPIGCHFDMPGMPGVLAISQPVRLHPSQVSRGVLNVSLSWEGLPSQMSNVLGLTIIPMLQEIRTNRWVRLVGSDTFGLQYIKPPAIQSNNDQRGTTHSIADILRQAQLRELEQEEQEEEDPDPIRQENAYYTPTPPPQSMAGRMGNHKGFRTDNGLIIFGSFNGHYAPEYFDMDTEDFICQQFFPITGIIVNLIS